MYKKIFDDKIDCVYGYGNYIYNYWKIEQISIFEIYNLTVRLRIIYGYIVEYFDLLFLMNIKDYLLKIL